MSGRLAGVNRQVVDEFMATGAVVCGRGTFEPDMRQWPLVTYVNGVTTAMTRAKEGAGDRNVLVHGAGTAQLAPAAGVLDEIELERTRILEGENPVTHMHYRPRAPSPAA